MTSSTIVSSSSSSTSQPKRPAYRVLEDPFEAEMVADPTPTTREPRPQLSLFDCVCVIVGIIIGSRFTPRAEQMVIDSGMPADEPPSSTFLDDERSKGNAWMIAGGVVAAAGAAALTVGIVRLIRDRKR